MSQHPPIPQKSFRRKTGILLGIGLAALTALPLAAGEQQDKGEPQQNWSPAFLSAMEQWQKRFSDMSFAEYVAAEHPDLMTEWVFQASRAMRGSILAFYQDSDPALVSIYEQTYLERDADGNVQGDDQSFVDFLIHGTSAEMFLALEREVEQHRGVALSAFVKGGADVDIVGAYGALPAGEPVHPGPLREFISQNYEDPLLDAEAKAYEAQASPTSVCSCVVLASAVGPNEDPPPVQVREFKNNGALKSDLSYWITKRGAARRLFTDRYILNGQNELNLSTHVASSAIQFTMSCTRMDGGSAVQCLGNQGCTAALKLDARYDSHLWVKNESNRAFPGQSMGSSVMTMDVYTLVANPGPSRQVLAEKGLAVERNFGTSISAESILQGVKSAYNIYTAVDGALSTDPDFGALLNNLNDEDINNVLAVATYNGERGETTLGFASSYTNSGGAPMVLPNGGSHKIEMASYTKAKSRGWGHTSRGRSLTASNYYLVGVVTNYSCNSATAPPAPKIAWSYGEVYQSPYSAGSMRVNVDGFIQGTTGLTLNTHAHNGTN